MRMTKNLVPVLVRVRNQRYFYYYHKYFSNSTQSQALCNGFFIFTVLLNLDEKHGGLLSKGFHFIKRLFKQEAI